MGTLGAVRFYPIPRLFPTHLYALSILLATSFHLRGRLLGREEGIFSDHPPAAAPASPAPHGHLGTLSECLFFFGIYSSHFGGTRKAVMSSNFWRRQRHPFIPYGQKQTKKPFRGVSISPLRKTTNKTEKKKKEEQSPPHHSVPLPRWSSQTSFTTHVGGGGIPSALSRQEWLRTAILPGMHLNPSDFSS